MKTGVALVLLSHTVWGLLPVFWKLLAAMDPVLILAERVLWSLLAAFALLSSGGRLNEIGKLLRDRSQTGYLAACGLLICGNWGLYVYAVNSGRILDSSLAYYLSPILSILIGSAFFRERLGPLQWLSVALAAAGVAVPAFLSGRFPWLSLAIGALFSAYGAMKKRVKGRAELSLFMEMLPVAPFALAFIVLLELRGGGATAVLSGWRLLLLPLAGVVTAAPLLLFSSGVRHVPYSVSGMLTFISPTLQLLIGALIYREPVTPASLLTFALAWAALVLFFAGNRANRPPVPAPLVRQAPDASPPGAAPVP